MIGNLCSTDNISEQRWVPASASWQMWGSTSDPQAAFTTLGVHASPTADTQRLAWLLRQVMPVSFMLFLQLEPPYFVMFLVLYLCNCHLYVFINRVSCTYLKDFVNVFVLKFSLENTIYRIFQKLSGIPTPVIIINTDQQLS